MPASIVTQLETELGQVVDVCDLLKRAEMTRNFLLLTGGDPAERLFTCMRKLRLDPGREEAGAGGGKTMNKILKQVRIGY